MLRPVEAVQSNEATARLRLRSPRQINRGSAQVRDGLTLPMLRATGGPPASSVLTRSSGPTLPDGGRRRSSVFDLPTGGQAFLERLRGQSRNASPLLGAFSVTRETSNGSGILTRSRSLAALQAQNATLRPRFQRLDSTSRFLLAQANTSRSNQGFATNLLSSSISLLG